MVEESLLEKDILKKILDGWFFLGRMSLTCFQVLYGRYTVEAFGTVQLINACERKQIRSACAGFP
jgi:hypothetical protein